MCGPSQDYLVKKKEIPISSKFVGWATYAFSTTTQVVQVVLTPRSENVRVRQMKVYGPALGEKNEKSVLPPQKNTVMISQYANQQALELFRHLISYA